MFLSFPEAVHERGRSNGPLTDLKQLPDDPGGQLRLPGVRRRKVGPFGFPPAALLPLLLVEAGPGSVDDFEPAALPKGR